MNIIGTKVWMTRGDSETITIGMYNTDNSLVPFVEGDEIKFTVRDKTSFDKVIGKVVTEFNGEGKAVIDIQPTDTDGLEFKTYVYDIQYKSNTGQVKTLVKPSDFTVEFEVSYE